MGSMITGLTRMKRLRLVSQLSALVVLNLPFLGINAVCAPAFYCHSCPLASMACPLGVLINFTALRIFPFIAVGTLALVGAFGARIVCGWVCPFGLLQDLLHKIPGKKLYIPYQVGYLRYAVLIGLVFAVPFFWPGKPFTFCDFCPSGTLESTIPYTITGLAEPWTTRFFMRTGILLGVIVLAVLVSRGFCRTLCPLGAIFSFFNRFSLFRLSLIHCNRNSCDACRNLCPVEIDPVGQMNHEECIRCLDCTTTRHIKIGTK